MKTFIVEVPFSGYSRGYNIHHVEAEKAEDALKGTGYSNFIRRETVRNDTNTNEELATCDHVLESGYITPVKPQYKHTPDPEESANNIQGEVDRKALELVSLIGSMIINKQTSQTKIMTTIQGLQSLVAGIVTDKDVRDLLLNYEPEYSTVDVDVLKFVKEGVVKHLIVEHTGDEKKISMLNLKLNKMTKNVEDYIKVLNSAGWVQL